MSANCAEKMHFHFCTANHTVSARQTLWDMYHWFRAGLTALGHTVTISAEHADPGAVNLFWEYFAGDAGAALRESGLRYGLIVTEVIADKTINGQHSNEYRQRWAGFDTARSGAQFMWSMIESNIPQLSPFAASAYVELGFAEELCRDQAVVPDLDFCFFGVATPYRLAVIDRFRSRGIEVFWPRRQLSTVEERDRTISRTKIGLCLKIDSQWPVPSPTRIGLLLLARRGVAAEPVPQPTRQSALVPMAGSDQDIVDFALERLNGNWQAEAELAFERYRETMPMKTIMERVLDLTIAPSSS